MEKSAHFCSFENRLEQLVWLAKTFGPQSIVLRYDPICHYKLLPKHPLYKSYDQAPTAQTLQMFGDSPEGGMPHDNLWGLERVLSVALGVGIKSVTIAFMRHDPKVVRHMHACNIKPLSLTAEQRKAVIMKDILPLACAFAMKVKACSDTDYVGTTYCQESAPGDIEDTFAAEHSTTVEISECISHKSVLWALKYHHDNHNYGDTFDLEAACNLVTSSKKDQGQRKTCNCCKTIDVGSYRPACAHACAYGYCSPAKYPVDDF